MTDINWLYAARQAADRLTDMWPGKLALGTGFSAVLALLGVDHVIFGIMVAALTGEKASSLLPVGVTAVDGDFEKGDIVRIIAPDGTAAGIGKVSADSVRARESIGLKGRRPLIHYDYLYID